MLKKTHPDYLAYKRYYGTWLTLSSIHSWKLHSILVCSQVAFNSTLVGYTAFLFWENKFAFAQTALHDFMMWSSLLINMSTRYNVHRLESLWSLLGSKRFCYGIDEEAETFAEEKRKQRRPVGSKHALYFVFFSLFAVVFQGLIRVILERVFHRPQPTKRIPGLCYRLPSPYWFPVDPCKNIIAFIIYVIFKYNIIFFMFLTFIALISTTIVLSQDIFTEFEILKHNMRTVIKRAEKRFKKCSKSYVKSKQTFEQILNETAVLTVNHHQHVLKLVELLKETLYLPLLFVLLEAIFRLCFACFLLSMQSVPIVPKIASLSIAATSLVHTGLICSYSQKLFDYNADIGDEFYFCDWPNHSKTMKGKLLMVLARANHRTALNSGGFGLVKLETFAAVLRTAFSYYSVLSAMSE